MKAIKAITILIASIIATGIVGEQTSALTYQSIANPEFTIEPAISVSVSDSNLVISDLNPGQSSDSNVITVTVASNNSYGYSLGSTVGSSTTYNTDNLKHVTSTDPVNGVFSNLETVGTLGSGEWGYDYSTVYDSSTSAWSNWHGYNKLPLYSTTPVELVSTSSADTSTLGFKIGANAKTSQVAGEYNNVVNFIATVTPAPATYYMQDVSTWASTIPSSGDSLQAVDRRDGKTYWVTRLADGNIWMTQNLDLDLSTNRTLTSNDTDLRTAGINGYVDGYTCSNPSTTTNCTAEGEIISWTPERDTVDAVTTETTSMSSFAWGDSNTNPWSMNPGNWYWKGDYYNSSTQCPGSYDTTPYYISCDYISKRVQELNGTPVTNNWSTYFNTNMNFATHKAHDHVGNYYNWSAAIASNNSSSYVTTTDTETTVANNPTNSICPAGWRLPTITTNYPTETTAGHNDFYNLNYLYNNSKANTDEGLIGSPTNFIRSGGLWEHYLHFAGYAGNYWSSTIFSDAQAYFLRLDSYLIDLVRTNNRSDGKTIRCIAR